jgi:hypothetical protein
MIETNLRIIQPGRNLYILTRRAKIVGSHLTPDLLERACGRLRYQHGMAAIVQSGEEPSLLVATNRTIPHIRLTDEDWELEVEDADEPTQKLSFMDVHHREDMALLTERALYATLARSGRYWTLDSPRIWYEQQPCTTVDGIQVYHRFEIGAIPIDDVGIGIAVDVGTAFFTADALDYFFDSQVAVAEQRRRRERFDMLTNRQSGHKGTLLYDRGNTRGKCYFEQAPAGVTCATTGAIRVRGETYTSLVDYYEKVSPDLPIGEDKPAVTVSFNGYDRPVWVPAERVTVRVMNDNLPRSLQNADKFTPLQRRTTLINFWRGLAPKPFGYIVPGLYPGFWQPPEDRVQHLTLPDLIFGNGQRLTAPTTRSVEAFKQHFRQREAMLAKAGCYYVPPTMPRLIHVAVPHQFEQVVGDQLGSAMVRAINQWTGMPLDHKLVRYENLDEAIDALRSDGSTGVALFVFNDEPTAYHDIAYNLNGWRVKRITTKTLHEEWKLLTEGAFNRQTNAKDLPRGRRQWLSFVEKSALDLVQQMDAVLYRYDQAGPFEGMLVIDVGHDRRHFALSLAIARQSGNDEDCVIASHVYHKPDHHHEAINATLLKDSLVKFVAEVLPRRAPPLQSLLVLRDGRFVGRELEALTSAITELQVRTKFANDMRVDFVDVRKDFSTPIRIWESEHDNVLNPLEGKLIMLNAKSVVLTTTGAATLTQSTADPYMLIARGSCERLIDAGRAVFIGAQLNYSSPGVAQRLPLILKRVDEELSARAAQEIKRLR